MIASHIPAEGRAQTLVWRIAAAGILCALLWPPGHGPGLAGGGSAARAAEPDIMVTLHAARDRVAPGGSTTLIWASTHAMSCAASGGWSGPLPTSGSRSTGALTSGRGFVITCQGAGGTASDTVAVDVEPDAAAGSACSAASGTLDLRARVTRTSGISPLLVFFDATATSDTAVASGRTAFQDIAYQWDFGDAGASGTSPWRHGSRAGKNLRNVAGGAIAAHLYVSTPGAAYKATVTAYDGVNRASCQIALSVAAPSAANAFAGRKTTCVAASSAPAAGSDGCPAGAATLRTASFNAALEGGHFGNGRRVLFKCGDTFSGDHAVLEGTHWSVGAYGACEGRTDGRPTLSDSGTGGELAIATDAGDGRIADIVLEGNGRGAYAVETGDGDGIPWQITLYNLRSNGNNASFAWSQGAQWGLIDSEMTGMRTSIGTYANFAGNDSAHWSRNPFPNLDYQAFLGNLLDGGGGTSNGAGQETLRLSACRLCVIADNRIANANDVGAVLKLHNGNPGSAAGWSGIYTELVEISDNWFGGSSGSQAIENSPQNSGDDERLRDIVFERNLVVTGPRGAGGKLLVSAVNETVRNNVFFTAAGVAPAPIYPIQVARRGVEPTPRGVEAYHNTCVRSQSCVGFDGLFYRGAPEDSAARNNLYFDPGQDFPAVVDKGRGNTVSDNSASAGRDPGFAPAAGAPTSLADFRPTANFSGAAPVPVWSDALGVSVDAARDLGAVHH